MKFQIKGDDNPVEVAGFDQLVEYMNKTAKVPSADAKQYMLDYSKRSVIYRNLDIRATDSQSFVEDLIKAGDIVKLN